MSRTVLVVDDEETVRRLLRMALERHGLQVVDAVDGEAAWAVLSSDAPVHLVLTDVVMPRLDGLELAARVREMQAPPRLIFMSGFLRDRSRLDEALGRAAPFVQKPFDLDELAELVHAELRETAAADERA